MPSEPIKIYIDEDAVHKALVLTLRSRGVTVFTALESELTGKADEEQLAFATQQGCVVYTYNVCDFHRLHTEWLTSGRAHCGIILAPQRRFSVGEQLRRILPIRARASAGSMRNRIEFLTNWG